MRAKQMLLPILVASALVALPVVGFDIFSPDNGQAFAGKGNGNGNGNANVGSGQKSGQTKQASLNAGPKDKSLDSAEEVDSAEEDSVVSKGRGSLAKQLGALNAAHANPKAFTHASAKSRIGKLRTYFIENAESLEAQQAAALADEAVQKAKDDLAQAEAEKTRLASVIGDLEGKISATESDLQQAKDDLASMSEGDEGYSEAAAKVAALESELSTAKTDLASAQDALSKIDTAALSDAVAKAEADAAAASAEAEAAEAEAVAALETAANKPVTEEVRAEVDRLLEGKIVVTETEAQ